MNDTLLGAMIAGGVGVLTSVVGGFIKWFLDVRTYKRDEEKINKEHDYQRDQDYLKKRIATYEAFIGYFGAYLSFLTFFANASKFSQEYVTAIAQRQTTLNDVFKEHMHHIAAIKMYGHPKMYEVVVQFMKDLESNENLSNKQIIERLKMSGERLDEIAHEMRVEINNIMCHKEEICI